MPDRKAGWALFLDFDGTLVDIADRPDAVAVDPALRADLATLKDRLGGALAIVSGRTIAFLDSRFPEARLDMAGLHGLEYRIGDTMSVCDPREHPSLREAVSHLADMFSASPGIIVEDKGCSAAVHWRLAPDLGPAALEIVKRTAAALGPAYRVQFGKAVAELVPAGSGKGRIIETFLDREPYRSRRPVFVGDDLTDESGFAAVNAHGGVSVRIGNAGESVASVRLGTPAELRHWLSSWAEGTTPPFLGDQIVS